MMKILVPMVADLFHWGHVNFLERIKNKYPNSTIIIGLISDKYVESYKRKPIMTFTERYKVLKSCKYVDEIVEYNLEKNFMEKNNIDFLIHANYPEENNKYIKLFKVASEKYIRFDYSQGISTTDILNRILSRN